MDVFAPVPAFNKAITKSILPTGLIDVGVTREDWKDASPTLATGTDVLQAVRQDPAVLKAQVASGSAVPRGPGSTTGSSYASSTYPFNGAGSSLGSHFERLAKQQMEALQSLAPEQLALLMRYVGTLRRQRHALQRTLECAFCKNNGESLGWYTQHALKDWRGRVLCPVLRAFRCPRCGATGDNAHTIKYCQENRASGRWRPAF